MKPLTKIALLSGVLLGLLPPLGAAAVEPPALDGAALYAEHCADCHKALHKSTKAGRSLLRVRSSIRHYFTMNHLKDLSDAELQAIVDVLAAGPSR